jgi:hypothetical protein
VWLVDEYHKYPNTGADTALVAVLRRKRERGSSQPKKVKGGSLQRRQNDRTPRLLRLAHVESMHDLVHASQHLRAKLPPSIHCAALNEENAILMAIL